MGTSTSGAHGVLWDDLRVAVSSAKVPASNYPTWVKYADNGAGSTGISAFQFSANATEYLEFETQVPHAYAEGSDITFHLHWMPATAAAGDVVLFAELVWTNAGAVVGNSTLTTKTVTVPGVALQGMITTVVTLTGTGKTISSLLGGRFGRVGGDGADTYGGAIWVRSADFHVPLNSGGSRQELAK